MATGTGTRAATSFGLAARSDGDRRKKRKKYRQVKKQVAKGEEQCTKENSKKRAPGSGSGSDSTSTTTKANTKDFTFKDLEQGFPETPSNCLDRIGRRRVEKLGSQAARAGEETKNLVILGSGLTAVAAVTGTFAAVKTLQRRRNNQ